MLCCVCATTNDVDHIDTDVAMWGGGRGEGGGCWPGRTDFKQQPDALVE